MSDTIPATLEALTERGLICEIRTTLYHFDEWAYSWQVASPPDEAPAGGERAPWSVFCSGYDRGGKCSCSDTAKSVQFYEVPLATWGDYMDSALYQRHNHAALLEDFEDHLIDVYGDMSSHMLLLPLNGAEVPELLIDAIEHLMEYPIYDESGYSEFETKMEMEDWESWGRRDFYSEVNEAAHEAGDYDFEAEEEYDEEAIDALFDQGRQDGIVIWQAESATGGYWVDFKLLAGSVYAGNKDAIRRGWEQYAHELTEAQYAGMQPLFAPTIREYVALRRQ